LLAALLTIGGGGKSRQSAPVTPQAFSFPVTAEPSEYVRRTRHFLRGGIGFGEWCVETCADYPWVAISGRFNCVLGSGPATAADLLRRILDTPSAGELLLNYRHFAPRRITNLSQAAAVAYLYATARQDRLDSHEDQAIYLPATRFLRSQAAGINSQKLSASAAIATILLAEMTLEKSERNQLLGLLAEKARGNLESFGLAATVRESMNLVQEGNTSLAESLATRGLLKYRSLTAWRNYEILKLMATDPVIATKSYGPLG
jgi:hypothetical protein